MALQAHCGGLAELKQARPGTRGCTLLCFVKVAAGPLWHPESSMISVFQPRDGMEGGSNKPPVGQCSCICRNNLALQ